MRKQFILRNKYTENSLRFWAANDKTPKMAGYNKKYTVKLDLNRINAVSGTVSPYLPLQEAGGTQKPKIGAKYIPMPTTAGRGGNIRKAIPKKFRLGPNKPGFGKGSPFFALPSGIYVRVGKPSKLPRAAPGQARPLRPIIMIRTLGQSEQIVKKTKWHESAMKQWGTPENMQKAYIQAAERELKRLREK